MRFKKYPGLDRSSVLFWANPLFLSCLVNNGKRKFFYEKSVQSFKDFLVQQNVCCFAFPYTNTATVT